MSDSVAYNFAGFGGTNAHAILEQFNPSEGRDSLISTGLNQSLLPFTFSAATEKSLSNLLESYCALLAREDIDLRRLAYTLACRRSPFPYKVAFVAYTKDELASKTREYLADDKKSTHSVAKTPSLLGVFTGQGAQWPQMGLQLIQTIPLARRIIEELDFSLATLPAADRPGWTILAELEKGSEASRLSQATIAQPLVNAVQLLLVNLLKHAGVTFSAVVGHSSGEIAAAYATGLISQKDAVRIAYYRGMHSKLARGPTGQDGGMLAVGTSLEDAGQFCALEDFEDRIFVAASNSKTSVTLSGDADAIAEAQAIFEEEGKFARTLKVDKAYHSPHMHPAAEPFLKSLKACGIKVLYPQAGSPKWFSSVHAETTLDSQSALDGEYWIDNLQGTVCFSQAVERAWQTMGPFDAAIEIGPHAALKGPATDTIQHLSGKQIPYTGSVGRSVWW